MRTRIQLGTLPFVLLAALAAVGVIYLGASAVRTLRQHVDDLEAVYRGLLPNPEDAVR